MLSSIPDFIKISGTTKISPKKTSSSQHWEMIIREGTKNAKKGVAEDFMQFPRETEGVRNTSCTTCSSRIWAKKFCLNS